MINIVDTKLANVAAIIVTHNPIIYNFDELIRKLQNQVFKIVIVDNASTNIDSILSITICYKNIKIIKLKQNIGIASAQNIGIRYGIKARSHFSLLFDQDSVIPDDFVQKMLIDFLTINKNCSLGILAPVIKDIRNGHFYPFLRLSKHGFRKKIHPNINSKIPFSVSCVIASGSLINNEIIAKVGLMNEELFIDYVDTEWCLRNLTKGYSIFVTPNVIINHEIGDSCISICDFILPIHSPSRRYYRVRNGFYLLMLPHVPKLVAIREIFFSFIHQIILYFLTKNKEYIKFYYYSLRDALIKINDTYYHRKS